MVSYNDVWKLDLWKKNIYTVFIAFHSQPSKHILQMNHTI